LFRPGPTLPCDGQARRHLIAYFGAERAIDSIRVPKPLPPSLSTVAKAVGLK